MCTRSITVSVYGCLYTPSDSLPTTELCPLREWPRVLAYMAEPMLYSDENESRFSASTSDLDLASEIEDGLRDAARGVTSTSSSIAEPLTLFRPKKSMRHSEALDGRRAVSPTGRIGASAAVPSDDNLTSMLSPPATGSLALAFLPLEGCHDDVPTTEGVLSVDIERDRGRCESMVRLATVAG